MFYLLIYDCFSKMSSCSLNKGEESPNILPLYLPVELYAFFSE